MPEPFAAPALAFSFPDRQGRVLRLRPLVPEDRAIITREFPLLSERTRLQRFQTLSRELTRRELDHLLDLDYHDRFAWGVEADIDGAPVPAAIGRYARYSGRPVADIGLTVTDALQGRGIGGVLLDALALTAADADIDAFETVVLAGNVPMLALLDQRGAVLGPIAQGVVTATLDIGPVVNALADHPLARLLRP